MVKIKHKIIEHPWAREHPVYIALYSRKNNLKALMKNIITKKILLFTYKTYASLTCHKGMPKNNKKTSNSS